VYGSQTGQAKAIAEDIAEKAPSHDLEAELHCADEVLIEIF
jgi:flavodoxin